METLKDQFAELRKIWAAVYQKINAQPETWKPYLPYSSPEEVNEIVATLCHWLERQRAPEGFAPVYRLAKVLIGSSLNNALSSLKAMEKGDYAHFSTFLTGLNQMLSSLHSMAVFGNKEEIREAAVSLGGQLAESISLLDTAQRELKSKMDLLEKANEVAKATESQSDKVKAYYQESEDINKKIGTIYEAAQVTLKQIADKETVIKNFEQEIVKLHEQSKSFQDRIAKQEENLQALYERNLRQQELIEALLPKGASAGLASAFGHRVAKLQTTKWVWMVLFIMSIGAFGLWSFELLNRPPNESIELWKLILQRIPIAAPFVWLGWFSAIQYGNTIRVQEDYAFKEATSKAFAGYKDHMEHMANVKLSEANTAMTLLAAKTIEILANEPLRIYSKSERDATPANSLFSIFGKGKSKTKEE